MPPWLPWLLAGWIFTTVSATNPSIVEVKSSCDSDWMNVTLEFSEEFRGLVSARGADCSQARGTRNIVHLAIDPKLCGIRISTDEEGLTYTASLQVQMSSAVQQAVDPVVQVKCRLHQEMLPFKIKYPKRRRGGRKLEERGRAWLEVRGSAISTFAGSNTLTVGEHTVLSVHAALPDGYSGLPVDCKVEDGRGSSQSLTDRHGCPTEPSLLPALRPGSGPGSWATAFPAFSFPDSSLVHYTCLLMICLGECPQYDCNKPVGDEEGDAEDGFRNSRDFQENSDDAAVVDFVELYNNVEVTAPNIELGFLKKDIPDIITDGESGGGWVCLSGPRVALVFAVLGGLFLVAVLATLLMLVRHRRRYSARVQYGLYT